MWERCSRCKKPLVGRKNVWKFKAIVGACGITGGVLGVMALPFIGFGAGGVIAGSYAAAWQSLIGNVVAGSLFATLQSLGATALGTVIFGSVGAGVGVLTSCAARIGWCTGQCDNNDDDQNNSIEKVAAD